jgi:thioredoxin 1
MSSGPSFGELINGETPVLIDVYADWCGPCQTMMPEIDRYARSVGDRVKVLKVNVDKNPALANAYGIRGVPTLMLFHRGSLVWRASGMHTAEQLMQVVESTLRAEG